MEHNKPPSTITRCKKGRKDWRKRDPSQTANAIPSKTDENSNETHSRRGERVDVRFWTCTTHGLLAFIRWQRRYDGGRVAVAGPGSSRMTVVAVRSKSWTGATTTDTGEVATRRKQTTQRTLSPQGQPQGRQSHRRTDGHRAKRAEGFCGSSTGTDPRRRRKQGRSVTSVVVWYWILGATEALALSSGLDSALVGDTEDRPDKKRWVRLGEGPADARVGDAVCLTSAPSLQGPSSVDRSRLAH